MTETLNISYELRKLSDNLKNMGMTLPARVIDEKIKPMAEAFEAEVNLWHQEFGFAMAPEVKAKHYAELATLKEQLKELDWRLVSLQEKYIMTDALLKQTETICSNLNKSNEKLLRKFKRIPATAADAYNESVALKEQNEELRRDLVLALETCQTLQAGIGWFDVEKENDIMNILYSKHQVGWGKPIANGG
jgi:chromosome segregation ATPase